MPALGGSLSFQGTDRGARASHRARGGGRAGEHHRNRKRSLKNMTLEATSVLGTIIRRLYVMLEERFPRRVAAVAGEPVLEGDPA